MAVNKQILTLLQKRKTKVSYLFKFAQLAKQRGSSDQQTCKIVFFTKEEHTEKKQREAESLMRTKILPSAEKFGISTLIDKNPILCNNESRDSLLKLREEIEKLVEDKMKSQFQ